MVAASEIGYNLLTRLLAGESEGLLSLHLAMFLEKSSRLDRGDDPGAVEAEYQHILPSNFAGLRLPPDTALEILNRLCAEVGRNPTMSLVSAMSFKRSTRALQTLTVILIDPPRKLTLSEYAVALSFLAKWLPHTAADGPGSISKSDLEKLVRVVERLDKADPGIRRDDRSAMITIHHYAAHFFRHAESQGLAILAAKSK